MIRAWVLAAWIAVGGAQSAPPMPENVDAIAHLLGTPGPAVPADQVDAKAATITRHLRCPVCQGLSVQDSPSHSAIAMKTLIHEMVAAGYTDEQIVGFFVSTYGEWVLLEPPASGLNWLLWIGPALVLGGGAAWAFGTARRGPREAVPTEPLPDDPYARRLLAALEDED